MDKNTIVGFIPARSGSKRCPGKNTRMFFGHPLIAYTIRTARESGIFSDIVVSTDCQGTIEIAEHYGASAILRPAEISGDHSTDYEWVKHAVETLDCRADAFGILRPTSPFRRAQTIQQCWVKYQKNPLARSLRTMRASEEHPNKAWLIIGPDQAVPWLSDSQYGCDLPTNSLAKSYYQDGLFYINAMENIKNSNILTHVPVIPHVTSFPENLDINTEEDFRNALIIQTKRNMEA
jgi:CMP-N-acetylneuraminic acid synthetase